MDSSSRYGLQALYTVGQSKPTDDGFLTEDILNGVPSLLITPLISRVGDSTGTTGNVHFVFIFHPQAYPLTTKVSGVWERTILGCVSGCTHMCLVCLHMCPSLYSYPGGRVSHVLIFGPSPGCASSTCVQPPCHSFHYMECWAVGCGLYWGSGQRLIAAWVIGTNTNCINNSQYKRWEERNTITLPYVIKPSPLMLLRATFLHSTRRMIVYRTFSIFPFH